MIYHLAENGTMAIILPHGALFRGGAEQHIRKYLIEDRNYLDAVIGLPANIFYGTVIPTCILVLKKCKEHPSDVLFVDASQFFEKAKNQSLLRDSDIEKIIHTYRNRTNEDKYSKRILLKEIKENDYNINISKYIDTFEADDTIDLDTISTKLKQLNKEIETMDKTIVSFCAQLNIATPF
jgi:type I restriction enzyme M protein